VKYIDCQVIKNSIIHQDYGRISLDVPDIASSAMPGQFVMLKYWQGYTPFLMRPFSINAANRINGTIDILYKVIGEGTALLQRLKSGEKIKILGPLGNNFPIRNDFTRIAIIGRGVGAAPLRFLADCALEKKIDVQVFISASQPQFFFDEDFYKSVDCNFIGSCDDNKIITTFFEDQLKIDTFDAAYTCGSKRLINDIKRLMDIYSFEGYASLEEHMACGIGACKGCVCSIYREGTEQYARVCKEGPIFPIRNLVK